MKINRPVPTTGNTPEPKIESCPNCGAIYSLMEPGGITNWGCSNVFHSRGRVAASSKEATPSKVDELLTALQGLMRAVPRTYYSWDVDSEIKIRTACNEAERAILKYQKAEAMPSPAREETPDENKLLDGICSDIEYARKWRKQDSWLALTILNRLPKSAAAGARSVVVAPQKEKMADYCMWCRNGNPGLCARRYSCGYIAALTARAESADAKLKELAGVVALPPTTKETK